MQQSQNIIDSYTFNPSERKITSDRFEHISIEHFTSITNLTTSEVIFDIQREGKSGVLEGNTLTLQYNTTKMSASDKLQILYTSIDPSLSTITKVDDSIESKMLADVNKGRQELIVQNDSDSILYLKFGENASNNDYSIKLAKDDIFITAYVGRVDGVWASSTANGVARVTEIK